MTPPVLHVVAMDRDAMRPRFLETVAELYAACGARLALHLRLRDLPGRVQCDLSRVATRAAGEVGGWCVVNGRVDVALVSRAQAVQLGAGALTVGDARRILPEGTRIGASVHDPAAARLRAREGVDYLVLGTIYRSRTHPTGVVGGVELIGECLRAVSAVRATSDGGDIPLIAIGGITLDRVEAVMRRGAHGVAVSRAVWEEVDPAAAGLRLVQSMSRASRAPSRA